MVLPVASSAVKLALDEIAYKLIEEQLDFGKSIIDMTLGEAAKIGDFQGSADSTSLPQEQGVALRRDGSTLLKTKEPGFGGLVLMMNKRAVALGDWEAKVREYLADLQARLESLNAAAQNDEERQEIFEIKRQTLNTLVRRVTIDRNRKLHVEIGLNLLNLINYDSPDGIEEKNKGQIKTAGIRPGWRYFFRADLTLQGF